MASDLIAVEHSDKLISFDLEITAPEIYEEGRKSALLHPRQHVGGLPQPGMPASSPAAGD